ncbi:MAG TPA: hypothetical protein VKB58_03455 [Terriglobales bacterium]|jgi:hypothetical protein|nr:hypothetical protein [Terriglobales bacterium]
MNRVCYQLLATALLLPLWLFAGDQKSSANPSDRMTPQTKILVMRDLTAERVFVRTPLPMGEKGLEIKDGKLTQSEQQVASLVGEHGVAARPGDRVVITNVLIKDKAIVFEINGGGKKHQKWYQHISMGTGGQTVPIGGAPQSLGATGSSVTLEFDKYVPELTGEQVRAMLAPVFDFKALNQAEAYEKTLPPKVREAIKNHQVLVGMDREMVVYAKGRAPKKVRDKDDAGVDYEEWIYGNPPEEVDFVRFQGTFVTRLEIMSVDGEKIVRTKKEVDLESSESEVAQKKDELKPTNAPSLLRPGEKSDSSADSQKMPQTPYPPPVDNPTSTPPGGSPPHWQLASVY